MSAPRCGWESRGRHADAHIQTQSSHAAPGAAGVSPLWFGRRACKNAFAKSRETADGVLTNAGAAAVAKPRVAYASPVLFARVRPPKELRLLRCTNAHAPGTASVSPLCVALTHLQRRYCTCSVDCRPACWRTPLRLRCRNHGGLTPPRSCFGGDAFVQRKSRFFAVERTPYTRAAGVSPP